MRARPTTPELFGQIARGQLNCPTIADLRRLARSESQGTSLTESQERLRSHLAVCSECGQLYQDVQALERAAGRAVDDVLLEDDSASPRSTTGGVPCEES